MLLDNKVSLVTGSGSGIGRAVAAAFAREGATVAITGHDWILLEQVTGEIMDSGGQAKPFYLDVTDEMGVKAAVADVLQAWGKIDVLVNNAGMVQYDTPVWATTVEEWDSMMAINLRGIFLCCHTVVPHMIEEGTGVIINIGSSSRRFADDDYGAYCASKWGVVGYTASLARSLRSLKIRVNGINPGWVDTDSARSSGQKPESGWHMPEEIAQTALFLAAQAPRGMTGQFIDVFPSQ